MLEFFKRMPRNIIFISILGFFMQIGNGIIYASGFSATNKFMTSTNLVFLNSLSSSLSSLIKPVSGIFSDRFADRKSFLMIGYGMFILTKIMFFITAFDWLPICVLCGLYTITIIIERLCDASRDAPRNALIVDSIPVGDNEMLGFSFSFRNAVSTMGSVLGAVFTFFALKNSLFSYSKLYSISIIIIIISVAILYFYIENKKSNRITDNINYDKNIWKNILFSIISTIFTFIINRPVLVLMSCISCLNIFKEKNWIVFLENIFFFLLYSINFFFFYNIKIYNFLYINITVGTIIDIIIAISYIINYFELIKENINTLAITTIIVFIFSLALYGLNTKIYYVCNLLDLLISQGLLYFKETKTYEILIKIPEKKIYMKLIFFTILITLGKIDDAFFLGTYSIIGLHSNYSALFFAILYISISFSSFFIAPSVIISSRRTVLIILVISLIVSTYFMSLINCFLDWIIAAILIGISNSLYNSSIPHLISSVIPCFELRGTMFGVADICRSIALIGSAIISNCFMRYFSFHTVCLFMCIPTIICFTIIMIYDKENI